MLRFIDFEVFQNDWLCVIITPETRETLTIVNDKEKLKKVYDESRNDIWVGFNIRWYDQYIFKSILLGINPKAVSDWIVTGGKEGWRFSNSFNSVPLVFYDVMSSLDRGLKYFEGSMGNSVRESSVPFNIERKLTTSEIAEVIKYCTHDVEQTIEVFIRRKSDFEAQVQMLKMFKLPMQDLSRTKVQLSAKVLEAKKKTYNDEFDISFPKTLKLDKYKCVKEWYEDWGNRNYKKSLTIDIDGVPHGFGWGGVHGARENYCGEGLFINMDVASLYPSLMILYNLHSRSCNPDKYTEIYHTRLRYKKEKNPMQAPLKIVLNGTYGAMKDKYNPLYDPRQANNVCVYGQLLLLDLMEKLEPYCDIIQSNTDGVLIRMPDGYGKMKNAWRNKINCICNEWQNRTGLVLEFDEFKKVYQKDVNNYVIVDFQNHYKSKGAFVKKLSDLDYDLAVVNEALIEYMVNDIPVKSTIENCNELKKFQMVKKISGKYKEIRFNGKPLPEKCVRIFACRGKGGYLEKLHGVTGRTAKLEGTPENSMIINGNINGLECPDNLNKNWYVELANQRLAGFIGGNGKGNEKDYPLQGCLF